MDMVKAPKLGRKENMQKHATEKLKTRNEATFVLELGQKPIVIKFPVYT